MGCGRDTGVQLMANKPIKEIFELYVERRKRQTPIRESSLLVKSAYYGDITLATPELDRNDKPMVANLLLSGGEQRAMRVASTMPDVQYPSLKPGMKGADGDARTRRLVNLAWWDDDRMKIKFRKRARHLVFYASTPVILAPNFKRSQPTWAPRDPLMTFAPQMDVGDLSPPDCIFTYEKSLPWLLREYPDQAKKVNRHPDVATNYVVLQYVDADEYVTAVIGEKYQPNAGSAGLYDVQNAPGNPDGEIVELDRVVNRIGRCPAVIADRIGLDHARGEFDGVIGLYQAQAQLMSLMVIGMRRAVWPEEWLQDNPNSPEGARIVREADPLHGIMGQVSGGTIQAIHPIPEAFGSNIVDQLERAIRIEAGVPAELGGESTSNVRTGKRGDAILSAVLDFPIQEEQEILEVAMREENMIAIEIDKAYFSTKKSIYLSATAGQITYEADQLWSGVQNLWVKFAHAGVDAQGLPVEIGQRVGMGTLSKRSAMEIDPLIEDPELEFDRMYTEQMRAGLTGSLVAMAQDPNNAVKIARIIKEARYSETEVEDAVITIDTAMQQEQAQQAAAAQAQQAPGPESQPGLAGAPGAAIQAPPVSSANLTALLSGLHRQSVSGQTAPGGLTPVGAPAGG